MSSTSSNRRRVNSNATQGQPAAKRARQATSPSSTSTTATPDNRNPTNVPPQPPQPTPRMVLSLHPQDNDDDNRDESDDSSIHTADGKVKWALADLMKRNPINQGARHAGRTVVGFTRIPVILKVGIWCKDCEQSGDDPELSVEEEKNLADFDVLESMIPDFWGALAYYQMNGLAAKITEALTNARGEDAKKVKEYIALERNWSPTLIGERKDKRGFAHPEIAVLLCPPHDSQYIATPSVRQEYVNRLRPLDAEIYPPFLYHNERIYEGNVWRGLLKGALVVKVAKLLFTGPRSLLPTPHISPRCNALVNNMTEMTLPAVAYAATMTYFGLTGDPEFTPAGNPGSFQYKMFYDCLLKMLYSQSSVRQRKLLEWWTTQIFGELQLSGPRVDLPADVLTTTALIAQQGEQLDDDLLE